MNTPKRILVFSAGLALIAPVSFAQQSVIDRCKQTSSDADHIACLEAALLGKDLPKDAPKDVPQNAAAVQKPEPEGIGASQVIARTQTKDEMLQRLEKAEGLVVASYDKVPYERLVVTLENGQVWRQIVGDAQNIRVDLKRNQTVDITESSFSGYKMRLNEMRRTVRVERIR
jgi:hypothetical protein